MISPDFPIFVHSDAGKAIKAAKSAGAKLERGKLQASLLDFLSSQTGLGTDGLIFPAFNYDYGKTRIFDVENDPVQVGALPEWVRCNMDFKRTEVPFFSCLSAFAMDLDTQGTIDPFGSKSAFQWLVDNNATILLFGTSLSRLTFLHYVEEMSGKPKYRYDKQFPGTIVSKSKSRECEFQMHVRPQGMHLDYDWDRLEDELLSADIMKVASYSNHAKWINASTLLEFWGNRIASDPLYLLDREAKEHFGVATNGGQNRITLERYENA